MKNFFYKENTIRFILLMSKDQVLFPDENEKTQISRIVPVKQMDQSDDVG